MFDFEYFRKAERRRFGTLLAAGRHCHSGEDRPLGFSSGCPCPTQPIRPSDSLLLSSKFLAINREGQGKDLAAREKKGKKPAFGGKMQRTEVRPWLAVRAITRRPGSAREERGSEQRPRCVFRGEVASRPRERRAGRRGPRAKSEARPLLSTRTSAAGRKKGAERVLPRLVNLFPLPLTRPRPSFFSGQEGM